MEQNPGIKLSVVATVYNDSRIVPLLVREIIKHVEPMQVPYEVILVNDGSKDNSEESIKTESAQNPQVKGISLSRNFGQQIAMSVGIRHAQGEYVVVMDGDLQNPPDRIPALYDEIRKGYDIVYTVSHKRNNFIDRFTSNLFWFVIKNLFKVNIIKHQLMMKIFTREFAERYNLYEEINRTVDGIAIDISSNYSIMEVENRERAIGKSHYNYFSRFNLMLDMVINLTDSPINLLIHLGWLTFFGTVVVSMYQLYIYIFERTQAGYTSIILSIFFFGSLVVLLLGLIGRYLSNINMEVKKRPLFHIKKTFNI